MIMADFGFAPAGNFFAGKFPFLSAGHQLPQSQIRPVIFSQEKSAFGG